MDTYLLTSFLHSYVVYNSDPQKVGTEDGKLKANWGYTIRQYLNKQILKNKVVRSVSYS